MGLRCYSDVQHTAIRLTRFHATLFAAGQIAIYSLFKILSQLVDVRAFIGDAIFAHPLYFAVKTIILFTILHTSRIAFVF